MKYLVFCSILIIQSCAKTVESEEQVGTIRFAGYDFEIIEYKTTLKKTGEVTERYLDTVLLIDCDRCFDLCGDEGDHQDYRR